MTRRRSVNGYVPKWPLIHRTYNIAVAVILILCSLPAMLAISLALFATQGPGIIYRGPRMGRNGRQFGILKFRTLDSARASALTQADVLRDGSSVETPLGGFLRATRLDELPQLFNVLSGDMNLVGPRPVRPELAAIYAQEIPNYDVRFVVKPGLMGWTQALMSHGASKHVRARLNFVTCRAPVHYPGELHLVILVGSCVASTTLKRLFRAARKRLGGGSRSADTGIGRDLVTVALESERGRAWPVVDWDEEEVILGQQGPERLLDAGSMATLVIRLPDGHVRRARVRLGDPVEHEGAERARAAYRFAPTSEYADHVISRYLHGTVVTPHRSLLLVSRIARRLDRALGEWNAPDKDGAFEEATSERA
jgi:lipopolysaccharide/colanic/teichoic acid biosynthesis glycosyltransferase